MKCHISDHLTVETTVVDPPPVQEMNVENRQETASSTNENVGHTNLELQPI